MKNQKKSIANSCESNGERESKPIYFNGGVSSSSNNEIKVSPVKVLILGKSIAINFLQPENIEVNLASAGIIKFDKSIDFILLQPENISLILLIALGVFFGKVTDSNEVHPSNK